jgi:hypothetical protein
MDREQYELFTEIPLTTSFYGVIFKLNQQLVEKGRK